MGTVIRVDQSPNVPGAGTAASKWLASRIDALERQIAVLITAKAARWYTGEGPPLDALGINGDLYFDKTNLDLYQKENSTWH